MKKENGEEMQTTPDLDQAMKDGRLVFDGTSPEDAGAPFIPGTPGPDAEDPGGEKPEEDAAHQKGKDTPSETVPRFKSHDEAERGYKELQGKATKAEQRAKEAEERAAAREKELEELRKAPQIEAEKAAERQKLVDYAATREEEALNAIDELDPESPDYRKQAAAILAQSKIDIFDHYTNQGQRPPAEKAGAEKPEERPDETDLPADTIEKVMAQARAAAEAEEIDPDDPLFHLYCQQAPVSDDKGVRVPLEGQIAWAVKQTKQYHDSIRGKSTAEDEAAQREKLRQQQEQDLPLGRGTPANGVKTGGKAADKAAEQKPISLSDALDSALEQRRL